MSKRPMSMVPICALLACSSGQKSSSDADVGGDASVAPQPTSYRVSLLSGTPGGRGAADGVAAAARFNNVTGLVGSGNELVAVDWLNGALRSVSLIDGSVRTLAGTLGYRNSPVQDGPALGAIFASPLSAALLGDAVFVADGGSVRRLSLSQNQVETLRDPATGLAWQSPGYNLVAMTMCQSVLYFTDSQILWRHSPSDGAITALAGGDYGYRDGAGASARFANITALACLGGALYAADDCTIRRIDPSNGAVVTVAGAMKGSMDEPEGIYWSQDGTGSSALFLHITGLASDDQRLYVSEVAGTETDKGKTKPVLAQGYGCVRQLDPATGRVTTLAGSVPLASAATGEISASGAEARFIQPQGLWADDSTVYVATASGIHPIIKSTATTSLLAGTQQKGARQIPGALAWHEGILEVFFEQPSRLSSLNLGAGTLEDLAIYDSVSLPISYCDGMVRLGNTLFCAQGSVLFAIGPTLQAEKLAKPQVGSYFMDVAILDDHLVVIEGGDGLAISEVSITDKTSRVLYQNRTPSRAPRLMATSDSVFLARRTVLERINRVTGTVDLSVGGERGCVDGDFASARFGTITGLAVDGERILVGDSGCHQLRVLDLGAQTVRTLVGSPARPSFAEGDSATASLNSPNRIVVDPATRRIYVADNFENLIAVVEATP